MTKTLGFLLAASFLLNIALGLHYFGIVNLKPRPDIEKLQRDRMMARHEELQKIMRQRNPQSVSLKSLSQGNVVLNQNFSLQAEIRSTTDLKKVHYQWEIPSGVELVSKSPLKGVLDEVQADELQTMTLELRQVSSQPAAPLENKEIRLRIFSSETDSKELAGAVFHTNFQAMAEKRKKEIDQKMMDMMKARQEKMRAQMKKDKN